MAIATCPKCSTKLKVPDGTTASVRCPKCQTVFKTSAPAAPAPAPQFEVVDDAPPKPAPKIASKPAPSPPPPPPVKAKDDDDDRPRKKRRDDDDEDDRPRKKRRDDDEDEDDRPRSKKRDPEDDEDDRPRKKRRADDEDEDDRPKKKRRDEEDEDDRPRGKTRSRDDDYDDEDDRPRKKRKSGRDDTDYSPPGKGSKFGLGRTGVLLLLISLGLYGGSMALQLLLLGVVIIGFSVPSAMGILTGILGLLNWIVGLVGLGFCIAGPSRARGLAIAAVSVSAVHLVLGFVVVSDDETIHGSTDRLIVITSSLNRFTKVAELSEEYTKELQKSAGSPRSKQLGEELKSLQDDAKDGGEDIIIINGKSSKSSLRWGDLTTALTAPDKMLTILVMESKLFKYYLLSLLWGLTEVARLVLICLMLGSFANVVKEYGAASKAKLGWIVAASVTGACILVILLVTVILDSSIKDLQKNPPKDAKSAQASQRSLQRWRNITEGLTVALHCGSLAFPALAAMTIFSASKPGGGGRRRSGRRDDDDDDRPRKKRSRRDDEDEDDD